MVCAPFIIRLVTNPHPSQRVHAFERRRRIDTRRYRRVNKRRRRYYFGGGVSTARLSSSADELNNDVCKRGARPAAPRAPLPPANHSLQLLTIQRQGAVLHQGGRVQPAPVVSDASIKSRRSVHVRRTWPAPLPDGVGPARSGGALRRLRRRLGAGVASRLSLLHRGRRDGVLFAW